MELVGNFARFYNFPPYMDNSVRVYVGKQLTICITDCLLSVSVIIKTETWDFPDSPVVPLQGTRVQSLVGELRSHVLHSMATQKINE